MASTERSDLGWVGLKETQPHARALRPGLELPQYELCLTETKVKSFHDEAQRGVSGSLCIALSLIWSLEVG